MKGDFTRSTFNASKRYSRVLMQQGRVQLDADWNELNAILLGYLRTLARDLIGPHGGPGDSFKIEPRLDQNGNELARDFVIRPGHYYVEGILCENEGLLAYTEQPDYPLPASVELERGAKYLVYLDVWERHITHVVDDSIREVALGGPDTATRARVVWQVKVVPVEPEELDTGSEERIEELKQALAELEKELAAAEEAGNEAAVEEIKAKMQEIQEEIASLSETGESVDVKTCDTLLNEKLAELGKLGEVRLRARTPPVETSEDPCITPPEARYRGTENQLYRVEIHADSSAESPTFKWSRDNGSVIFPIRSLTISTTDTTASTTVSLEHLGRDSRFSLREGDWVEVVDDDYVLQGRAEALFKVSSVDRVNLQVTLEGAPASIVGQYAHKHPLLRRWDQKPATDLELKEGAVPVQEDKWLNLEDRVQIYFEAGGSYRTGDYWLIPARTATGDVEWPADAAGAPKSVLPHGIKHHYAPLAIISLKDGMIDGVDNCRCEFPQLCAKGE